MAEPPSQGRRLGSRSLAAAGADLAMGPTCPSKEVRLLSGARNGVGLLDDTLIVMHSLGCTSSVVCSLVSVRG